MLAILASAWPAAVPAQQAEPGAASPAPAPAPAAAAGARRPELPPGPYEQELVARAKRWKAERGKPQAVVAVLGALSLWDRTAPDAVAAFVNGAAADAAAHPLARAVAQYLAAQAASWQGNRARATELRARLGIVETWSVIGPFGFEGGDLIGTPYGPEAQGPAAPGAPAARTIEKGKRGDVAWRPVPVEWLVNGVVPLGGMLRPDTQAAGYGLTYVWSDRAREVAVRVGSTGAVKVWVAGQLVIERKVKTRGISFDQDAGRVRLERGWNPVLVKVAVEDGAWAFLLRFTELGGAPLVLKAERAPPAGASAVLAVAPPAAATAGLKKPSVARPVPAPPTLRALLEARANDKKASAAAREAAGRDLAIYLAWIMPEDPETKPIEAALAAAGWELPGAAAETLLAVSRYAESADKRRRAAEALAMHPGASATQRAEARWRLGRYYNEEAGIPRRAREELEAAAKLDPGFWPARLELAETLVGLGLSETALVTVRQLVAERPFVGDARRTLARHELAAGRPEVARAHYERLLDEDKDDTWLMGRLADLARDRGDTARWTDYLRAIVNARPTSVSAALALAAVLRDLGDVPGALAALDAALIVAPDDATLLEESGRTLVERGGEARRPEGIARLKRAIGLRPQNPELRRYLTKIAPAPGDDLEKQYARKVPALIARYKDWAVHEQATTVLLDLKVTRVHDNGLSEVFVQRVVRIEDQTGAEQEKWQAVQYSPDTQSVEVRTGRVHKASGEIVEAKLQGVREVSEPWYGLYYDVRSDVTGFERLEAGDVVEYSYVLSDTGRRNLYADYFGDMHYLGSTVPQAEVEYTLLAPPAREFFWRLPSLAGLKKVEDEVGGEKRTRLTASKIARVQPDAAMPGWTEVAPYIHVSTYKSWDQVARWYWRLIEEQLVSDQAVRQAAQQAVKGLSAEQDRVRAIHNLVVKSTRYVGLEFGIHSFKPYRVPTIFERKFGDCKDKASLIVVMLREVGVPAQLILIRTRKNGDVDDKPASLAIFDHAIAYVPSLDLYLDGTAEFSGSRELPYDDQGVMVLRIDGGDGMLARTPVLPATENVTTRHTRLELDAAGAAKVTEDVEVRGQGAPAWRQHYQTPGERPSKYEKAWNGFLPGVQLDKVDLPDVADLEQPVTSHAEGRVPQVGTAAAGGARTLPPMGRPSELTRSYARTSKRLHDLVIDYPWTLVEEIEYTLPAGARLADQPAPAQVDGPFGSARLAIEVKDAGGRPVVTIKVTLSLTTRRVSVKDYPAFRDWLGRVDGILNQPIEIAP